MQFDNPGTIAALQWFKRMHDENLIPKSVWLGSENPAELFQAGVVACHIGGSWNVNTYRKNVSGFEWGAVQMPKGPSVLPSQAENWSLLLKDAPIRSRRWI